jgi:hypothetical protein
MPIVSEIKSLPFQNMPEAVDIKILPLSWELANRWHTEVQPIINKNYQHWAPGCQERLVRADVGWSWPRIKALRLLHDVGHVASLTTFTKELCVTVEFEGKDFPIGMLTLVPKYKCNVERWGFKGYMWYLSSAPQEVFIDTFRDDIIGGVAKTLIDCAILASYNEDGDGSLLLHADSKGGIVLHKYYIKNKFKQVPEKNGRITNYRWRNRTQYYHLSAHEAKRLVDYHNSWR